MVKATHILIDLRWMIPGYTGGIEVSARAFIDTTLKLDGLNEFTVLLPSVTRYDFDLRGHPNFRLVTCDGPGYYLSKLVMALKSSLGRHLSRAQQDVWIQGRRTNATIALSPSGILSPDLYPLKNLLMVHDIQHEYYPQFFTPEELANRVRDYKTSFQHADHLCANSEFTRQTLIERMRIPPDKVSVVYHGIHPIFSKPPTSHNAILARYGLVTGNYLFYPANTWPHKNHRLILEALRIINHNFTSDSLSGSREPNIPPIKLVCTGVAKEAHPELLKLVQEYHLQDQVCFLGYRPFKELPALYQGATALVFPSLFEGFGMPVLEAMNSGCPVICSNVTSLPEIAGDAALFIDPTDPSALAEAILRLLTQPALREELIKRGRVQSTKFSWTDFSLNILRALHHLANQSTPVLH